MENIEETITQMYIKNLNFLKNNYSSVYEKIIKFEEMKIENYFVEFVDGHFDILDTKGDKLYNCDPFYDALYRAKNIFDGGNDLLLINEEKRDVISCDEFDSNLFINEFIELAKSSSPQKEKSYKKMVFVGTLLGVHINDIDNSIHCGSYLVYEKNIEIFRLSLFFTDYELITKKSKLFFIIEEDEKSTKETLKSFLDDNFQDNYYLKFEIVHNDYIEDFEKIIKATLEFNPTIYPYSEIIRSYINGLDNFNKIGNGVLSFSKKNNLFNDYPVLFLGAGPSLHHNIEIIKNSKDNVVIVAAISGLKELAKENIVPDIIISIDSSEEVLGSIGIDEKFYKDAVILLSINTNYKVFEKLNCKKTFLVPSSLELFIGCGYFTGVTVGDVGVKILLSLGVKELYLCGIDASLNQETGATHVETYIDLHSKELKEKSVLNEENIDYNDTVIKVKGNFQKEVYTTIYYKTIIDSFDKIEVDKNINIYNISFGAYLSKTKPTNPEKLLELNPLNKKMVSENIKVCLDAITKRELSNIDILNFKRELEALSSNSIDKYKGTYIYQILQNYNRLILPYYNYLLNTTDVKKEKLDDLKKKQQEIIYGELKSKLQEILSL